MSGRGPSRSFARRLMACCAGLLFTAGGCDVDERPGDTDVDDTNQTTSGEPEPTAGAGSTGAPEEGSEDAGPGPACALPEESSANVQTAGEYDGQMSWSGSPLETVCTMIGSSEDNYVLVSFPAEFGDVNYGVALAAEVGLGEVGEGLPVRMVMVDGSAEAQGAWRHNDDECTVDIAVNDEVIRGIYWVEGRVSCVSPLRHDTAENRDLELEGEFAFAAAAVELGFNSVAALIECCP